ncbi:TonB-dependent receptor [Sphingosinicella sp. BN140058]|nr:TonB-dependent receptor [Sphingosinicella sp. BN140058]
MRVTDFRTGRRALLTTSRAAIGVAAFSFAAPLLAQGAGAAQPVTPPQGGQPAIVQQPNTAPVEQGSTTSDQPRPDQADEQIADPAAEATNVTEAQADPGAGAAADETIVVTGTRASLQGAIARKKNAGTQVDSIVAEDIASFPDKNIGEALQRVTGVQLSRVEGEGSQVSIRGVEPDLNRVEINGASVLGSAGARGGDFRELASELVKSIDVFKGFTADMTEGGVGGTVSIQTRRPLELRDPLLAVTASMQNLETLDKWRPRGNITAGGKFLDGRLGFLVNLTYDKVDTRSDFQRNTEWRRFSADATQTDLNNDNKKITENANFTNITTPQGCNAVPVSAGAGATRADCLVQFAEFVPGIPRYSSWERNDQRISGVATIQYQVTDRLDVYAEYQRNSRKVRTIDNNFAVDVQAFGRIDTSNNCATCTIDDAGNLIGFNTAATGSFNAAGTGSGAGSIFSVQFRDFIQKINTDYKQVGFNYDGESFRLSGFGVLSKGTTWNDTNSIVLNGTIPSIRVDLDPESGNPRFGFPADADPSDIDTFLNPTGVTGTVRPIVAEFQYRPDEIDTKENQFKIDGDFDVDSSFLKLIEIGAQYRTSSILRYGGGINSTGSEIPNAQGVIVPTPYITARAQLGTTDTALVPTPNGSQVGTQQISPATLSRFLQGSTDFLPYTFFPVGDRTGLPDTWLRPNFNGIGDYFDQTYANHDRLREVNGVGQIPTQDVDEKIYAAYLKGNFDFEVAGMAVNGNLGVRYVRTEDTSTGFVRTILPGQTVAASADFITISNSYEDWLPSANLSIGIIPNQLILFAGASKVLARPRLANLAPNITCNIGDVVAETQNNCTAGNPDLEPYRANQFDLSLSWYPNRDTLISAAAFYKNIQTFVIENVSTFDMDLFGTGELFDLRRPENGRGAKIKGLELTAQTAFTFLPAPFDGFGIQANYTYSDAKDVGLFNQLTGEELPYPFLSKHSYNLVAYYDKDWLNFRLAYNGRSNYLRASSERSGNAVFNDGTGYLDAKLTLRFPGFYGASLFVEGKNLTKETERQTSGDIRMTNYEYSGRRFYAGASFKF